MLTVSVVMPNRNHGRFLRESVGAILSQDPAPKELVVIDDASTDDSLAVLESLAAGHPSLMVLRQETHQGVGAAIRRGFAELSSDLVFIASADDRVRPGLFARSIEMLERHPEAGMCSALARILSEDGEDKGPLLSPRISEGPCFVPPGDFAPLYLRHGNWVVVFTGVYRREALLASGAYDVPRELDITADGVLNVYIPARHGTCFIPEFLTNWRRLEGSYAFEAVGKGLEKSLERVEKEERRLCNPPYSDILPETLLRSWKRRALHGTMYEFALRHPERLRDMTRLESELPGRPLLDRLFFFLLRSGLAGRRAFKLYHFLGHPPQQRREIARGKLRGLAGLG